MPPTAAAATVPKMPTICPDSPKFAVLETVLPTGAGVVWVGGAVSHDAI